MYTEFLIKSLAMLLRHFCLVISKHPYSIELIYQRCTYFLPPLYLRQKKIKDIFFYTFIKSCHLLDWSYECCLSIYLINTFLNQVCLPNESYYVTGSLLERVPRIFTPNIILNIVHLWSMKCLPLISYKAFSFGAFLTV